MGIIKKEKNVNIMAALLLIFTIGCQTVEVTKDRKDKCNKTSKVDGIPFYVKKASCITETVWQERVYEIKLVVEAVHTDVPSSSGTGATSGLGGSEKAAQPKTGGMETKEFLSPSKVIASYTLETEKFKNFRREVDSLPVNIDPNELWGIIGAFDAIDSYSLEESKQHPDSLILFSNMVKTNVYVDYETTYYVNSNRPLIGSANVATELNVDGTLTKGSAEVVDKTAETVIAALPIGDIVKSFLIPPVAAIEAMGPAYKIKLEIHPKIYHHILSKKNNPLCSFPCTPMEPIKLSEPKISYKRIENGAQKTEPEKDKNTINVSGKIVLPKED